MLSENPKIIRMKWMKIKEWKWNKWINEMNENEWMKMWIKK